MLSTDPVVAPETARNPNAAHHALRRAAATGLRRLAAVLATRGWLDAFVVEVRVIVSEAIVDLAAQQPAPESSTWRVRARALLAGRSVPVEVLRLWVAEAAGDMSPASPTERVAQALEALAARPSPRAREEALAALGGLAIAAAPIVAAPYLADLAREQASLLRSGDLGGGELEWLLLTADGWRQVGRLA